MNPLNKPVAMLDRIRSKNLLTWLGGYARYLAVERASSVGRRLRGRASDTGPRHLLFAICDHYEPRWGKASVAVGERRVDAWHQGYPALVEDYRDADDRPPQHSFFFPGEEYEPQYLDALADLARRGYGEVELHLHHDRDTAATLRERLETGLVPSPGRLTAVGAAKQVSHGVFPEDPSVIRRGARRP